MVLRVSGFDRECDALDRECDAPRNEATYFNGDAIGYERERDAFRTTCVAFVRRCDR